MKKPRIIKIDYFKAFYCIDLDEIQAFSFDGEELIFLFRNAEGLIIDRNEEKDKNGAVIEMLGLNTYTSWKNYDDERGSNTQQVFFG